MSTEKKLKEALDLIWEMSNEEPDIFAFHLRNMGWSKEEIRKDLVENVGLEEQEADEIIAEL